MIDTTIKLITPGTRYQDDLGVWRTIADAEREILAQMNSIDRNEFFSAGEAGFKPEYQFTVFAAEYQGESVCEYDGKPYSIYRTYHVPGTDMLELYVQRKSGVQRKGGVDNGTPKENSD